MTQCLAGSVFPSQEDQDRNGKINSDPLLLLRGGGWEMALTYFVLFGRQQFLILLIRAVICHG